MSCIAISSPSTLQFDSLIGYTVEIMVNNVADLAGNKVIGPVTWSFTVADYSPEQASVHVSGYVLDVRFDQYQQFQGSGIFTDQIAMLASVPTTRLTSITAYSALDGQATVLAFVITPSGDDPVIPAVAAAQTLAQSFSHNFPYKVSLSS
jgi:hypothetical protein